MLGAGADALGRPADPRARALTCPTEDFSGRLWLGAGRHPARTKCWEPGEAGGRSLIAGGMAQPQKAKAREVLLAGRCGRLCRLVFPEGVCRQLQRL